VTGWLENYAAPGPKVYQNGVHYPSNERPFRAFSWTDHSVKEGDRISYRVVPFLAGSTEPSEELATHWERGSDAWLANRGDVSGLLQPWLCDLAFHQSLARRALHSTEPNRSGEGFQGCHDELSSTIGSGSS
jgi:hypothetical protein